ncbi:methyltransferase domain-containing protein [Candidatus Parcubacteria bacterium]|nr:methyltransferase domain-containing protein [Candidatus Parcubacteria bacterium]
MFSDPEKNVLEFGFIPGQKVVDLGSGAGHYAAALSRLLGPSGRVYAVDIDKDMLVKIKNDSAREGRDNIEVIWGDIEKVSGTKLRDNVADGAVFSNILFQLDDKAGAVAEAKRVIKPGGRICVVEWADLSFLKNTLSSQKKEPVTEPASRELFASAGVTFERSFDAGESHYGAIFRKPLQ